MRRSKMTKSKGNKSMRSVVRVVVASNAHMVQTEIGYIVRNLEQMGYELEDCVVKDYEHGFFATLLFRKWE